MEQEKLLSIRLPEAKEKEVYIVRLTDGRIIARTKDELEKTKEVKKE